MTTGTGLFGTPDFFHTCGTNQTAPPSTFSGYSPTHSGLGMMGLVLYNVPYANYREYISASLTSPMVIGKTYTLSFWLNNGASPISPWTIANIGAHFSVGSLSQSGYGIINVVPQCEITSNVAVSDWTKYDFTLVATGAWNTITIGSFRTDVQNGPIQSFPNQGGNPSAYANYFVDDVSLSTQDATSGLNDLSGTSLIVYPNPLNERLYIKSDIQTEMTYEIRNTLGEVMVMGTTDRPLDLNTQEWPAGFYTAIIQKDETLTQVKLVKP